MPPAQTSPAQPSTLHNSTAELAEILGMERFVYSLGVNLRVESLQTEH